MNIWCLSKISWTVVQILLNRDRIILLFWSWLTFYAPTARLNRRMGRRQQLLKEHSQLSCNFGTATQVLRRLATVAHMQHFLLASATAKTRPDAVRKCADALVNLFLSSMPAVPAPNKWTTLYPCLDA